MLFFTTGLHGHEPKAREDLSLVSPLDIPCLIIRIPRIKPKYRDQAIRFQLRNRYPGDLSKVSVDYLLYPASQGEEQQVMVFIAHSALIQAYRAAHQPLIPGLSLMTALYHRPLPNAPPKAALILLHTPRWMEAARFDESGIAGHVAMDVEEAWGDLSSWFALLDTLSGEGEPAIPVAELPVLALYLDGASDYPTAPAYGERFPHYQSLEGEAVIQALWKKGKKWKKGGKREFIRKNAIFKPVSNRSRWFILAALVIHGLSLLCSLEILRVKAERYQGLLRDSYQERMERHAEFQRRLDRIAALEKAASALPERQRTGPYELIAEIQSQLQGGWIRGITIGEDRFDLEAEGSDAAEMASALGRSRLCSSITVHEVVPSTVAGDRFTISGTWGAYDE